MIKQTHPNGCLGSALVAVVLWTLIIAAVYEVCSWF